MKKNKPQMTLLALLKCTRTFIWKGSESRYGTMSNICGAARMASELPEFADDGEELLKQAHALISASIAGEPSFRIWYEDTHPETNFDDLGTVGWQALRFAHLDSLIAQLEKENAK